MTIHGIVLAGGLSRRLGGRDKALLDLSGRPLLAHVLDRFMPQCHGLVLNGNGDPSRFAAWPIPVVADDIQGFAGPLAGILAGLDWIAAHRPEIDVAVSCAVDTPFLPTDFVARLDAARYGRGGTTAACATSGGKRHPVAALWPLAIRHELRRALVERQERRVSTFLDGLDCIDVSWSIDPFDPFVNINTPADLAAAARLLARKSLP